MEGYKYNDNDLLIKELPQSLSEIYGRTRPLTKEEIANEEDKRQADKERMEKQIEKQKEQRCEKFARLKADYQSGDQKCKEPEAFIMFLSTLESSQEMYDTIVDTSYKKSELFDDDFIAEIEKLVKNERLYGDMKDLIITKVKKYFDV